MLMGPFTEIDHDPGKEARQERKARIAKNEKQRHQNLARAAAQNTREARKRDIERGLAQARISTASMGRFDKQLEGEKKPHGVKRKASPARTVFQKKKKSNCKPSSILLRNLQMRKRKLPLTCCLIWKATPKRCGKNLGKTMLISVKL
jgi:regulator of ribosome biosynthesis